MEIDKPEVVAEPPPRAKRARTEAEAEASELLGPSSLDDVWAPKLMVGMKPITAQDTVLDTSNVEHSAKVAHALGAATCLPGDIQVWDEMSSSRMFRHIPCGLIMVS